MIGVILAVLCLYLCTGALWSLLVRFYIDDAKMTPAEFLCCMLFWPFMFMYFIASHPFWEKRF